MVKLKEMNGELKILYLIVSIMPLGVDVGVYEKERAFCEAMHEICKKSAIQFKGINIYLGGYERKMIHKLHNTNYFESKKVNSRFYKIFANIRILRILPSMIIIRRAVYKEIESYRPNVIVYRYPGAPLFASMLFNPQKIDPNILFISMHNTKESDEFRLRYFGFFLSINEKIKGRKFFKNVDAIVGVTSEIAKYEVKRIGRKIPYFVLTNGIDVKKIYQKEYLKFKGSTLRMIFLSHTFQEWQGLDKLLIGMTNYHGNIKLELNIVGSVTQDVKRLVKSLNLEDSIVFHGFKTGKELDKIFDNTHIAIASLGFHRKGLSYASTLKVREYMAGGIPIVISHIDEDIEDNFPLVLKLPSDDSAVNMDEVIKFTERTYKTYGTTIPNMMRDYAFKKMDYKSKIPNYVKFILNLLPRYS